eukprot:scaffold205378_cov20-Prasinocladus_malaysianus.AAC.2
MFYQSSDKLSLESNAWGFATAMEALLKVVASLVSVLKVVPPVYKFLRRVKSRANNAQCGMKGSLYLGTQGTAGAKKPRHRVI